MMRNLYHAIDKGVVRLVEIFVSVMLITFSLLVVGNSALRYLFGANQSWVEEVARILMVWMAFLGSGLCVRSSEHVVMDMLLVRFKPAGRRVMTIIIGLIGAAATAYLFYLSCIYVSNTFRTGQFSPILGVSTGVIYLCLPLGFFFMAKEFIGTIIRGFGAHDTGGMGK